MDSMPAEIDGLSLLAASPTQLNLAAIFITTLEEIDSDASTAASLQSLWEVLTEGCSDEDRVSRMRSTFEESSLELLPVLAPLLNRPSDVAELAQRIIVEGLGGFASPREVILAVGEQIEDLLEVERPLGADGRDSSADDDGTDDDEGGHQAASAVADDASYTSESDSEEESVADEADDPPAPLDAQLPTLVRLLALRVPQMRGRKALPTVLHLSSLLRPAVSRFASHRPPVGLCREVALAVTRLVAAVHEWAQTDKDDWSLKGEQTPLLLGILSDTIVRLRPGLNLRSIERVSSLQGIPPAMAQSIGRKSLPGLGDWPEGLDEIAAAADRLLPTDEGQTFKTLGLLSSDKLAHFGLILLSNTPPSLSPADARIGLRTLVDGPLASDTAIAASNFVWSLLKSLATDAAEAATEEYIRLVPQIWRVYIPLLAADPDPQTRKALFALLSKSIAPSLLAPTKALDLFFPLPSPFFDSPLLRPAGLHFLRGLIVSPGSLAWLQGSNLERLETEVFSLPFSTGQRPEAWDVDHDLSGETWIRGPGPIAVVLALNIYALLVTRDVNNESGIRRPDAVADRKAAWVEPLRRALNARPRSATTTASKHCSTSHSHSHSHDASHRHSHSTPDAVASGEDEEESHEGEESDAAWETVTFALEGVEKALAGLT